MSRLKLPKLSPKLRENANTVLDLTVKGLEVSKDAIIAAAPVPGLSVALQVAIELLKKIQDTKSNSDALSSLCNETTNLAKTLTDLAELIESKVNEYPAGSPERGRTKKEVFGSKELLKRVKRLQDELRAICADADKLSKRSPVRRFLYSTEDAETITDIKNRISTARERFQVRYLSVITIHSVVKHHIGQIEGSVTIEALVNEVLSGFKRLLEAQKVREEERILDRMPRAQGAHYTSATNTMKARLQAGTRGPVFERLEAWEETQYGTAEEGARPICVLVGEAGTGKSTIASEFSKRLEKRGRLGASFFFTRGEKELDSPRKFFSTISSQLARSQSALRIPVVNAAREHLSTEPLQQLERECEHLLQTPLSKLPPSHPPIFIVVDALDECTEEGPELVPVLLHRLLSCATGEGSPLRVFLTSRPEPHYIHKVFADSALQTHIFPVSLRDFRYSVNSDIEELIRARLSEDPVSKSWCDVDQYNSHDTVRSVVETLVAKSDGLFIYARTAVDFILGDMFALQERYDLLIQEGTRFGMTALDDLYRTVLQSVFPSDEQYPQLRRRLHRVLEYLVTLQKFDRMSPATLENLTGMASNESVSILNKLLSVIIFNRDNVYSPFRIIHATFREFLTDPERANAFYISVEDAHGRLADDCLRTIRTMGSFLTEHFQCSVGAVLLYIITKSYTGAKGGGPTAAGQHQYPMKICTYSRLLPICTSHRFPQRLMKLRSR
ncbi:hypothetical protein C8T65DRAFT_817501 [Cerioporus squamosus]|nr:hypothetical protein C8T65DRAFT_817501 [Cerioporus squamosus]